MKIIILLSALLTSCVFVEKPPFPALSPQTPGASYDVPMPGDQDYAEIYPEGYDKW